jgi:hypothetical protein
MALSFEKVPDHPGINADQKQQSMQIHGCAYYVMPVGLAMAPSSSIYHRWAVPCCDCNMELPARIKKLDRARLAYLL